MAKFNAAFWKWFGKSVVTKTGRAGGEPRAMYHGSAAPAVEVFKSGRHERIAGWFFFSKRMAEHWAKSQEETYREDDPKARATVYRVYLRAERPFDIRKASHRAKVGMQRPEGYEALYEDLEQFIDAMIEAGFDSYLDFEETARPTGIAVFSPTQIKSATGNRGTWDPTDADIRRNPQQFQKAYSPAQIMSIYRSGKIPLDGRKVDAMVRWLRAGKKLPAIVRDKKTGDIIDGMHRAAATEEFERNIRHNPSYKEIEFVCVNREFPGATPPAKQRALLRALTGVAGVFPYRQDWGEGQVSLAVIIVDPKAETEVRRLAKAIGVKIDIDETFRTEKFLDAAIDGEMEGQI